MPDKISEPVLRIAQITDTHLYADPEGKLLGLNTHESLKQVIELAHRQAPQIVVASGDLTHDGSSAAYEYLRNCFSRLGVPVYCLPGNHDEASALHECLNSGDFHSISATRINGWQLIFMNSTIKGEDGGHLGHQELEMLDKTLAGAQSTPALIWLHHQPVNMGSKWLDTMAVDNPQQFFEIVDRHKQIKGIIWGHVHQCFDQHYKQVRMLSTPSTCIQFLPNSDDFALDFTPPGYRWLNLFANGDFTTGVLRLSQIPGEIDSNASGY